MAAKRIMECNCIVQVVIDISMYGVLYIMNIVADETYQKLQLKLFAMNQLLLGF